MCVAAVQKGSVRGHWYMKVSMDDAVLIPTMGTLPFGPKHITRESVDMYFAEVQSQCTVQPHNLVVHVANSLQWWADDHEYVGEAQPFIFRSHIVKQNMDSQQQRWMWAENQKIEDPHANLPS